MPSATRARRLRACCVASRSAPRSLASASSRQHPTAVATGRHRKIDDGGVPPSGAGGAGVCGLPAPGRGAGVCGLPARTRGRSSPARTRPRRGDEILVVSPIIDGTVAL